MSRITNQAVLFAANTIGGRCPILAAEGEPVVDDIFHVGPDIGEFLSTLEIPKQVGFFVWEGDHVVSRSQFDAELDIEWDGTVRPATAADFMRFGFPLPTD